MVQIVPHVWEVTFPSSIELIVIMVGDNHVDDTCNWRGIEYLNNGTKFSDTIRHIMSV